MEERLITTNQSGGITICENNAQEYTICSRTVVSLDNWKKRRNPIYDATVIYQKLNLIVYFIFKIV